ncbi:BPL-N domain-containing protein [Desulfonauticus submarinus]
MKTFYVSILWDESHLWVLLVLNFFKTLSFPVAIISAKDIQNNWLNKYKPKYLIVPGGWASLKAKKLTVTGIQNIRDYVKKGGVYIGFCGGSGLALKGKKEKSLNLCPLVRKKFSQRLPNFSGDIWCKTKNEKLLLPVWWPSQFEYNTIHSQIKVLAKYDKPGEDFWISDLKLNKITSNLQDWEQLYQINLNPLKLKNEPCIIQGKFGQGKYILSYPHLETPASPQANKLFAQFLDLSIPNEFQANQINLKQTSPLKNHFSDLHSEMLKFIEFCCEHFLVLWRRPWLLAWRRGIPGSFFNFILAYLHYLQNSSIPEINIQWKTYEPKFKKFWPKFIQLSTQFILTERYILTKKQPSSPIQSSCTTQQALKQHLFGQFPGYGGIYGQLISILDELALTKAKLELCPDLL